MIQRTEAGPLSTAYSRSAKHGGLSQMSTGVLLLGYSCTLVFIPGTKRREDSSVSTTNGVVSRPALCPLLHASPVAAECTR